MGKAHWHYFPSRSLVLSISLYFVLRCGLIKTASSLPLDTALFASSDHEAPYLRKMPASLGSHQIHPWLVTSSRGDCTGWTEIRRPCLGLQASLYHPWVCLGGSWIKATLVCLSWLLLPCKLISEADMRLGLGLLLFVLFFFPTLEKNLFIFSCLMYIYFPPSTQACLIKNYPLCRLNY